MSFTTQKGGKVCCLVIITGISYSEKTEINKKA